MGSITHLQNGNSQGLLYYMLSEMSCRIPTSATNMRVLSPLLRKVTPSHTVLSSGCGFSSWDMRTAGLKGNMGFSQLDSLRQAVHITKTQRFLFSHFVCFYLGPPLGEVDWRASVLQRIRLVLSSSTLLVFQSFLALVQSTVNQTV